MKKVLLLTVLILLLSSVYLFSAVPCKINYQGRLIKDNVPVDGTKTMRFSIYDSAVGGTQLWTSGDVNITVYNGLFRYVIGSDGGDLSTLDWTAGQELYLEVIVDGETLTPREELYAYPYAINSHLLEGKTTDYFLNTSGDTQTKQGNLNIIGNLGIGTTGPAVPLDVNGTVRGSLWEDSGNPVSAYMDLDSSNIALQAPTGNIIAGRFSAGFGLSGIPSYNFYNAGGDSDTGMFHPAEDTIAFSLGNSEKVRFTSGGNVGIGTESPGAKLEVAGNFRATGGIEPDYDSGWVKVDRINSWGLKTWTHNLNYFPRQIQWWFSTGNPGSWVGPVAWSKHDHWSNPLGVWITLTQIKFSIWHDRYVYRMFNASSQQWSNYNSGYYRILFWK